MNDDHWIKVESIKLNLTVPNAMKNVIAEIKIV